MSRAEWARQWWNDMITPKLTQIASQDGNELCVGLLACGALVMHDDARTELMKALNG